ncbi:MAG: hypothetical protein LUG48_11810, partial [Klebsiella quasipneumoniae]|nr:hypothetical protein [Klebsiella quasipneumoniae]
MIAATIGDGSAEALADTSATLAGTYIGGLVGASKARANTVNAYTMQCVIQDCSFSGRIQLTDGAYVGALVGANYGVLEGCYSQNAELQIANALASGEDTDTSDVTVGGLVGVNIGSGTEGDAYQADASVKNCYVIGTLTVDSGDAAYLIGTNGNF